MSLVFLDRYFVVYNVKGMLLVVEDSGLPSQLGLRVIPESKVNQYLQRSRLECWLWGIMLVACKFEGYSWHGL